MQGHLNMSARKSFLIACIFLLNLPAFLEEYAADYQNQLNACFEAKFGWETGKN